MKPMDLQTKKNVIKTQSELAFAAFTAAQTAHEAASATLVELKGSLSGEESPRVTEINAELAKIKAEHDAKAAPFLAELDALGVTKDARKARNAAYTAAIEACRAARAIKLATKKQWDTLRVQYNNAAGKGIIPETVAMFVQPTIESIEAAKPVPPTA